MSKQFSSPTKEITGVVTDKTFVPKHIEFRYLSRVDIPNKYVIIIDKKSYSISNEVWKSINNGDVIKISFKESKFIGSEDSPIILSIEKVK